MLHLNDALTETNEIGTDTDTAASNVTKGEDLVVSTGGLASDLSTALEVLDTNAVNLSNDIIDSPALVDLVGVDIALRKSLVILVGKVEVLIGLGGALSIVELDVDLLLEAIV